MVVYKDTINTVLREHPLVLLSFYADWSAPSKAIESYLESLKLKYGREVCILDVDADKYFDLLHQFSISSLPTLLYFKEGEVIYRCSGALDLPCIEKEIRKAIKKVSV